MNKTKQLAGAVILALGALPNISSAVPVDEAALSGLSAQAAASAENIALLEKALTAVTHLAAADYNVLRLFIHGFSKTVALILNLF